MIEIFVGTSALATILPLIVPPIYAFLAWLVLFLALLTFLVLNQNLIIVRVLFGHDKTLDFIAESLGERRGDRVFSYSSYTIPDKLIQHPSHKKLNAMLEEEGFESYTRVVVLATTKHLELNSEMLRRHGSSARFRFGVLPRSRAIPINILTSSSGLILVAIPSEASINQAQGDAVSIVIRNKRIYSFFSTLTTWLWNSAVQVKQNEKLNAEEMEKALKKLNEVFNDN